MSDYEEARKWLQLGFETYGLDGMMEVANAMGLGLGRNAHVSRQRVTSRDPLVSWPIFIDQPIPKSSGNGPYSDDFRLAASKSECIEKCYRLLERLLPSPGSDVNTWDFHKCVNECMGFS